MTEKEKRALGKLYDANFDQELLKEQRQCKELCFKYNALPPKAEEAKSQLLRALLGSVGKHATVLAPFWCDFGYHIHLGENFFANHGLVILDGAPVRFGTNVFIGPQCVFYTATHPLDAQRRNKGLEWALPITIGNNVWIGGGVFVLPGVTIGDNTVIGGGSVVTHDIPDHVVAVGNPCTILRPLTSEEA